jgi:16S rRNA processing protein RimM
MRQTSSQKVPASSIVVVGKLGRPYGVRGWQVLHSFTEPADNLFAYSPWYIQSSPNASWTPVAGCDSKPHKEAYVAQINGIDDRDEAQLLTGALIGVARDSIPDPQQDEYFWHDLIGSEVTNQQGDMLGQVAELMETGAHAILSIKAKGAKRDLLVPFTEEYVLSVDAKQKQLVVNWQADWS